MKIAIVALVLVAAVSVNGKVLAVNGMAAIDSIIGSIDSMSAGATDLNTMESRLKGLEAQKTQIDNALRVLSTNLNRGDWIMGQWKYKKSEQQSTIIHNFLNFDNYKKH